MGKQKYNTGEYKIEKGIPIDRKKKFQCRFPFDKMKIGDSFYIPTTEQNPALARVSIFSAVNSFNRTHNTNISVTTRSDTHGLRVWRIADQKKK